PGVVQWQNAGAEAAGFDEGDFDKLERLTEWGYPAERIDSKTLAELEPDIDLDTFREEGALYYPEDGWLDGPVYAGAMVLAARRRYGLKVVQGRVTGLLTANGTATGVKLATGERIEADVVINSSGRWANEAVGNADYELPLAPTVGLIAYTVSCDTSLRHGL